jgi:YgiT-type zinc finger domain-containing protein
MKCHVCGGPLERAETDMPFKIDAKRIVILKRLPVLQCGSCGEYLIEDPVLAQVDAMLAEADERAELEIMSYAA